MSLYIEGNVVSTSAPETAQRVTFTFEQLAKLLARLNENVSKYDVLNDQEFQRMTQDGRAVVYGYLSTVSSYMRALIYSGTNPDAGDEASSDSYLRTQHAAEQKRMWEEVSSLERAIREALQTR